MYDLGKEDKKSLVSTSKTRVPVILTSVSLQRICTCLFIGLVLTLLLSLPIPYRYEAILEQAAERGGAARPGRPDKVISCYYNTPAGGAARGAGGDLAPSLLRPHLCTHINVAFATIADGQIHMEDHQYKSLKDVVKLKSINPNLKVLLSVGGAGNDTGFPEMVVNHKSRKIFIRSIKSILKNYSLDGIDLDWEFPAMHQYYGNVTHKRERQHFSQLLREIKSEYAREKRPYLLTVAVAAPQTIVDVSYDIDQLNLYTDYVNVMTYDFHVFSKVTPFTGLNSPLYARPSEHLYMASLNINHTVHMYLDKGLERDKIVIGIPTYGHSFTLVNIFNNNISSPAKGFGSLGSLGFVGYPDICLFQQQYQSEVHVRQEPQAEVPYLYRYQEWVSYDTPHSVMEKAKFIRDMKLRGAMIYSLNSDDFNGVCNNKVCGDDKFPLSQSVRNVLIGESCR